MNIANIPSILYRRYGLRLSVRLGDKARLSVNEHGRVLLVPLTDETIAARAPVHMPDGKPVVWVSEKADADGIHAALAFGPEGRSGARYGFHHIWVKLAPEGHPHPHMVAVSGVRKANIMRRHERAIAAWFARRVQGEL